MRHFKQCSTLRESLIKPSNLQLEKLYNDKMYGNYFFLILQTNIEIIVPAHCIISRCLFISDCHKNLFLTEIDSCFEHN